MLVRMIRDHEYVSDKKTGKRRRLPAGWRGVVDEGVGQKAVDAGDAEQIGTVATSPSQELGGEQAELLKKSRADLDALAKEKGIDPAKVATKEALVALLLKPADAA